MLMSTMFRTPCTRDVRWVKYQPAEPARIVAIAHQDCSWYKEHKLFPFKLDLRERQLTDLKRVAARLRETFPDLTVETYFARLTGQDPERVVFEPV